MHVGYVICCMVKFTNSTLAVNYLLLANMQSASKMLPASDATVIISISNNYCNVSVT